MVVSRIVVVGIVMTNFKQPAVQNQGYSRVCVESVRVHSEFPDPQVKVCGKERVHLPQRLA